MSLERDVTEAVNDGEFIAQIKDAACQASEGAVLLGRFWGELGVMGLPDDLRRDMLLQANSIYWQMTLHHCGEGSE